MEIESAVSFFRRTFERRIGVLALVVCLGGCGLVPYPEETTEMQLSERISRCLVSAPALAFPSLSNSTDVTDLKLKGNCEVWFMFHPFADAIGEAEWVAAQSGVDTKTRYSRKGYKQTFEVLHTVTEAKNRQGAPFRTVTTQAAVTGENGTISASVESYWRPRLRAWVQTSALEAAYGGLEEISGN
jgi:hypothetical protein